MGGSGDEVEAAGFKAGKLASTPDQADEFRGWGGLKPNETTLVLTGFVWNEWLRPGWGRIPTEGEAVLSNIEGVAVSAEIGVDLRAFEIPVTEAGEPSLARRLAQVLSFQLSFAPATSVALLVHQGTAYISQVQFWRLGVWGNLAYAVEIEPPSGEMEDPWISPCDRTFDEGPVSFEAPRTLAGVDDLLRAMGNWLKDWVASEARQEAASPDILIFDSGTEREVTKMEPTAVDGVTLKERIDQVRSLMRVSRSPLAVASFACDGDLFVLLSAGFEPENPSHILYRTDLPRPGEDLGDFEVAVGSME